MAPKHNAQKSTAIARQVGEPKSPSSVTRQFTAMRFTGPIPDPASLKAYDMIIPGLADRIVTMAEKQSAHRMNLETITVTGDNRRANWGLVCGTLISLAVLGVCALLAMNNHETTAAILAGIDIVSLAGVFVYGNSQRQKERQERIKQLEKLEQPSR